MTLDQAKAIIGNRADWELSNMIRALSWCELLNSPEDTERLEAAKIVRRAMRKAAKR